MSCSNNNCALNCVPPLTLLSRIPQGEEEKNKKKRRGSNDDENFQNVQSIESG